MSDKHNYVINFQLNHTMVMAFARLSGDHNSMHVDPEIARKSRYRRTVVHGMLPFSFLQLLQSNFQDKRISFREISSTFRKPMYEGDRLRLEIEYHLEDSENGNFKAKWYKTDNEERVISAKGKFSLVASKPVDALPDPRQVSMLEKELQENQYLIGDLKEKVESLSYSVSDDVYKSYAKECLSEGLSDELKPSAEYCSNLLSTLMLSTLVGMRLPGRYATFTKFSVSFSGEVPANEPIQLTGVVTKSSESTEIMIAKTEYESNGEKTAHGKIEVILNPPPKQMVSCEEIKQSYCHLGMEGKVVLITGASRGIGETTAKLFGMLGAKVVINYFKGKTDAQRIVDDIVDNGGDAFAVQCDITSDDSVKSMINAALDKYKKIDILVNNAVRDFTPKNITEMTWEDYCEEFDVSIKGMHACCREVIPVFKKEGGGKIINLSTVAVHNPVAGQSRYVAAKSAVEGYTKSLAKELVKQNIQANLVVPNMADTDLVSVIPSMYREKIADSRPYKRHIRPVEVAQSIVYLASSWSDAITGQKVVLNLGEPPFA